MGVQIGVTMSTVEEATAAGAEALATYYQARDTYAAATGTYKAACIAYVKAQGPGPWAYEAPSDADESAR